MITVWSLKSINEFNKLVPEKIDRDDKKDSIISTISPNSFGLISSSKDWERRRKLVTKTIGINFASKYIQMMIETVDEWSKNIKLNEKIDFTQELNKITFNIISKILFGRDIYKIEKWEYTSPHDGSVTFLSFVDAYFRHVNDELIASFSLKSIAFSFLKKFRITEPFKSNYKNNNSIFSTLAKFLDTSEDSQSVYTVTIFQIIKKHIYRILFFLIRRYCFSYIFN